MLFFFGVHNQPFHDIYGHKTKLLLLQIFKWTALASYYPAIKAAVAIVPSHSVFAGITDAICPRLAPKRHAQAGAGCTSCGQPEPW